MIYACNFSTREVKAGGSQIWGQSGLHSEFQVILVYKARLCLNKQRNKQNPQKLRLEAWLKW
jgi:hypothetical protein